MNGDSWCGIPPHVQAGGGVPYRIGTTGLPVGLHIVMKITVKRTLIFLSVVLLAAPSLFAGDIFRIRRVRLIDNPTPDRIEGDEVVAVTFRVIPSGWVNGVGWSLRYYDGEKERLGTVTEAYFLGEETSPFFFHGAHLKGTNTFTALFPFRTSAVYTVIALGNQAEQEVVLFPYSALLQDFNLERDELLQEIASSGYTVLPPPEE